MVAFVPVGMSEVGQTPTLEAAQLQLEGGLMATGKAEGAAEGARQGAGGAHTNSGSLSGIGLGSGAGSTSDMDDELAHGESLATDDLDGSSGEKQN